MESDLKMYLRDYYRQNKSRMKKITEAEYCDRTLYQLDKLHVQVRRIAVMPKKDNKKSNKKKFLHRKQERYAICSTTWESEESSPTMPKLRPSIKLPRLRERPPATGKKPVNSRRRAALVCEDDKSSDSSESSSDDYSSPMTSSSDAEDDSSWYEGYTTCQTRKGARSPAITKTRYDFRSKSSIECSTVTSNSNNKRNLRSSSVQHNFETPIIERIAKPCLRSMAELKPKSTKEQLNRSSTLVKNENSRNLISSGSAAAAREGYQIRKQPGKFSDAQSESSSRNWSLLSDAVSSTPAPKGTQAQHAKTPTSSKHPSKKNITAKSSSNKFLLTSDAVRSMPTPKATQIQRAKTPSSSKHSSKKNITPKSSSNKLLLTSDAVRSMPAPKATQAQRAKTPTSSKHPSKKNITPKSSSNKLLLTSDAVRSMPAHKTAQAQRAKTPALSKHPSKKNITPKSSSSKLLLTSDAVRSMPAPKGTQAQHAKTPTSTKHPSKKNITPKVRAKTPQTRSATSQKSLRSCVGASTSTNKPKVRVYELDNKLFSACDPGFYLKREVEGCILHLSPESNRSGFIVSPTRKPQSADRPPGYITSFVDIRNRELLFKKRNLFGDELENPVDPSELRHEGDIDVAGVSDNDGNELSPKSTQKGSAPALPFSGSNLDLSILNEWLDLSDSVADIQISESDGTVVELPDMPNLENPLPSQANSASRKGVKRKLNDSSPIKKKTPENSMDCREFLNYSYDKALENQLPGPSASRPAFLDAVKLPPPKLCDLSIIETDSEDGQGLHPEGESSASVKDLVLEKTPALDWLGSLLDLDLSFSSNDDMKYSSDKVPGSKEVGEMARTDDCASFLLGTPSNSNGEEEGKPNDIYTLNISKDLMANFYEQNHNQAEKDLIGYVPDDADEEKRQVLQEMVEVCDKKENKSKKELIEIDDDVLSLCVSSDELSLSDCDSEIAFARSRPFRTLYETKPAGSSLIFPPQPSQRSASSEASSTQILSVIELPTVERPSQRNVMDIIRSTVNGLLNGF